MLGEADTMLGIQLYDAAGRTAYLAGFHAAQALISEKLGRAVKTHRGVHSELYRLTKDDPRLDAELSAFLSRAYNLKAVADYETGPDSEVSPESATAAVETSKRFVDCIASLIEGG